VPNIYHKSVEMENELYDDYVSLSLRKDSKFTNNQLFLTILEIMAVFNVILFIVIFYLWKENQKIKSFFKQKEKDKTEWKTNLKDFLLNLVIK